MVVDLSKLAYEQVLEAVKTLSPEDRVRLAQDLWDSVEDDETGSSLTEEERAMLEERLAAMEANPSRGIPWEQVKAELLARKK